MTRGNRFYRRDFFTTFTATTAVTDYPFPSFYLVIVRALKVSLGSLAGVYLLSLFWNIIVVVVVLEESLGTNVTLDDDEAVVGIELVVCDGSRVEVIVIIVIIVIKEEDIVWRVAKL